LEKKDKYGDILSPISLMVLEFGINEIKSSISFFERLMELD
jgi:hypothetical protein